MKEWKIVKLGKLLIESKIDSIAPDSNKRIRVKLNIGGVEKRPDTTDKEGATKYYIRKAGQFIYGKQNLHKGAFGIVPIELDGYESSSDIPAFDIDNSCYPEWIYYFFKQGNFYLKLESLAKGVGSKRIQPKQLFDLNIALPTKEEQRTILDSVEIFEHKYSNSLKEIHYQLSLLKKLNALTLQNAIEGKLTEKWREKNFKKYSAITLVTLIKEEKKLLLKTGRILKEKPLTKISPNIVPFSIPDTWIWERLGNLIKDKPKNGTSPQAVNYVTNTKSLKLGATTKGVFDGNEFKYLDVEISPESHLWLEPGDILIQRSNSIDYVGISAIYNGKSHEFIYPDLMMKIKPLNNINTDFLFKVLSAKYVRNYFRTNASGTSGSMPKINQSIVLNTLICLPPIEEQKTIIDKLNDLSIYYIDIERQVNNTKNDLEILYRKTLSSVFVDKNTDLIKFEEDKEKFNYNFINLMLTNSYFLKNTHSVMELEELLKAEGKMSAISLWKMSKFENDIDAFYEELKRLVEGKKTIKESEEKGFLELVK